MAKCFCFGGGKRRRKVSRRNTKNAPSMELPPPAIGRVPTLLATDDCIYTMAIEGKTLDLKRILTSSTPEEKAKRLSWTDSVGRSPLIAAVKEGNLECVHTLLNFGADVHQTSHVKEEGTALHVAIRKRLPLKVIYSLLSKGASPFVENHYNCTAWELAQMNKNWTATSIFRNLGLFRRNLPVQVGSNASTTSTRDVCILPRYECQSSTMPRRIITRTMHISSIGPGEEQSDFDLTGVQTEWMPEDISDDIASILLTFPASRVRLAKDLSSHSKNTGPVMHLWIPKWSVWSLREFLDVIEQTNSLTSSRQTAEDLTHEVDERIAQWIGRQTASQASLPVDDFITGTTPPDEIYKKAALGDSRELKYLLKGLTEIEKLRGLCWEDTEQRTPLMVAAQKGYQKCVRLLLEHGANVHHNSRGEHAGTALHIAVANGGPSNIVECLLSYNANPLVENYHRVTAADLGKGEKSLILKEEMLFNETMNGSITLKGKAGTLGSNKDFQILIAPRYGCCDRPQDLCRISKTLHVYEAQKNKPLMELDLYDTTAEILPERQEDYIDIVLTFSQSSILTWNWLESDRPEEESSVQVWISYRSVFRKFSEISRIINTDDGMHIVRSVKNVWKASWKSLNLSSTEQAGQSSATASSSTAVPLINDEEASEFVRINQKEEEEFKEQKNKKQTLHRNKRV